MNMQFTYETELSYQGTEYYAEVFIDVTNVVVVPPDPMCRSSAEDYYGIKEMEWNVVGVKLNDENGDFVLVCWDEKFIRDFDLDHNKIEAWLWEKLENTDGEDYSD